MASIYDFKIKGGFVMELLDFYADWCGPCLFLKDGEEVAREVGVLPLKKLEKIYEKL